KLGVSRQRSSAIGGPGTRPESDPAKRRGWRAMHARRLRQFELLRQFRGGFARGCRNRAALLYVVALRKNGVDTSEIESRVADLCRECRPALSRSEYRDALKTGMAWGAGGKNRGRITNLRNAAGLLVTTRG